METDFFRFLVHDAFGCGHRDDFIVECTGFLSGRRSLLALQCKLILLLTRNAVSLRHHFGSVEHTHINVGSCLEHLGIRCAIAVVVLVLHKTDRFHAAAYNY